MTKNRYRKWLIIWSIITGCGLLSIIGQIGVMPGLSVFTFSIGSIWLDFILIICLVPALSILAYLAGVYLLTPMLLAIHVKIVGRGLVHGIEEKVPPARFKGAFGKALMPALLSFHFGLLLSSMPAVQEVILSPVFFTFFAAPIRQILTLIYLLPALSAVTMFVVAGPYTLLDCGFVTTNKELDDVKNGLQPTEIKSVGSWYTDILNGYAGISIIFDFLAIIIPYLAQIMLFDPVVLVSNLGHPAMPFFLALMMIPTIILEDALVLPYRKRAYKFALKLDIKGELEDPLGRNRRKDV